jgi:hypothetical protein
VAEIKNHPDQHAGKGLYGITFGITGTVSQDCKPLMILRCSLMYQTVHSRYCNVVLGGHANEFKGDR